MHTNPNSHPSHSKLVAVFFPLPKTSGVVIMGKDNINSLLQGTVMY